MKSTGIVRRIDELGRIVVPKEIRRTLKIREGDTLEIYVEKNSIILRKFSHLTNFITVANQLVSIVSSVLKKKILIVDLDHVVACNRELEEQYLNNVLTPECVNLVMGRKNLFQSNVDSISFINAVTENCSYVVSPILVDSDILGAVILFDSEPLTEMESLVVQILSSFFVRTVEE